jgi:Spx/MgsR family transcriptional regulator
MVTVYGIKNCDSVRKALRFFKNHEIAYELIDFRETPVDEATIRRWLENTDLKTLFNTRGTTYRTL